MSILINKKTNVICQGITGKNSAFEAKITFLKFNTVTHILC